MANVIKLTPEQALATKTTMENKCQEILAIKNKYNSVFANITELSSGKAINAIRVVLGEFNTTCDQLMAQCGQLANVIGTHVQRTEEIQQNYTTIFNNQNMTQ